MDKIVDEMVKEIERRSNPMNTNMYGISLSKESWQAIKDKYSRKREGIKEV